MTAEEVAAVLADAAMAVLRATLAGDLAAAEEVIAALEAVRAEVEEIARTAPREVQHERQDDRT